LAHAHLKLFHNMRAALHIPDEPPKQAPPASGPGRNDAFGLLSFSLFGVQQPYAPVKYDVVQMGYLDEGLYLLDTTAPGNGNMGHDYGTALSAQQKRELIEYLKTL
jgi:hypothetical protein